MTLVIDESEQDAVVPAKGAYKLRCVIEAYTEGDTRRAHARAVVKETTRGILYVIPIYLREVSGPHVPWTTPPSGRPILTQEPINTFDDAQSVLRWWAS